MKKIVHLIVCLALCVGLVSFVAVVRAEPPVPPATPTLEPSLPTEQLHEQEAPVKELPVTGTEAAEPEAPVKELPVTGTEAAEPEAPVGEGELVDRAPSVGRVCSSPADCGGAPCIRPGCPTPPVGVCGAQPVFCTLIWDPVCGCDGVTYSNGCFAGAAGVDVACKGECPCQRQPNLAPYTPSGWDYPIVPSSVRGTTRVNTLYAGQPTYIDWAVINNGSATASGRFYSYLYLDGNRIGYWYTDNLAAGYYAYVSDWSYTVNTPGWHTLKIVADATGAIAESNEGDNSWERSFYWQGVAQPNLTPYTPSGWDYPIVPSSVQGTTRVNTLYAGQPTYIDWAVINNGSATASGRFYSYLYLDGTRIGSWYKDNLQAGYYTYVSDWSYTVSTPGWHTLKIVADATGAIAESNENDNTWERNFYWEGGGGVTVTSVWTTDGSGNNKTTFNCGDSIRYYGNIYNNTGSSKTAYFNWSVTGPCGSIASWSGNLTTGTGNQSWYLPATIPSNACAGTYTYKLSVTYSGSTSSKSTTFTVNCGIKKVVLDPGHGWCRDGYTPGANCPVTPGASGYGMVEKDVVLDIANRTKSILQGRGIQVYMTRTDNDPYHHRSYAAQYVNQVNPNIAASIHANAAGGTGTEACYQDRKSTTPQSKDLSQRLTNAIASRLSLTNRGIFSEYDTGRCGRGGKLYIHDMNPTAALIETAFIDNANDADKLRNRRQDFAQAIADALLAYLGVP